MSHAQGLSEALAESVHLTKQICSFDFELKSTKTGKCVRNAVLEMEGGPGGYFANERKALYQGSSSLFFGVLPQDRACESVL